MESESPKTSELGGFFFSLTPKLTLEVMGVYVLYKHQIDHHAVSCSLSIVDASERA